MQRIGTQDGLFSPGNPANNTKGTTVTADWLNAAQEEMAGVIEGLGGTLDPQDNGQLFDWLIASLAMVTGNAAQIFRVATAVGASDATPLAQVQALIAAGEAETTLTDQATITWDWSIQGNAKVTLGGNRTMAAPSNLAAGKYAAVRIAQDGTGGRVLSFAGNYKGMTEVSLSTGDNEVDWLLFRGVDGTNCELVGYRNGVSA